MSDDRFHPADGYSRSSAFTNDAGTLTSNFEHALANPDGWFRAGALEVVASVAIARVRLLERQLAEQEGKVRARLFERTGNVVALKRAPEPSASRPGA